MPRPKIDDINGTATATKPGRMPSASELTSAIEMLKRFRDSAKEASKLLKKINDEVWPIADESEGGPLVDHIQYMVDTVGTELVRVVSEIIEDMEPGEGQGAWAREILPSSKSAQAAGAPSDIVATFYQRLDQAIENRGLSRRQFADQLAGIVGRRRRVKGISRSQVNRWFQNRPSRGPNLVFLGYLAVLLDTTIDALLDPSIPVYALPPRGESPAHASLNEEEREVLKLAGVIGSDEAIRRLILARP